jgi:hypothetical protein
MLYDFAASERPKLHTNTSKYFLESLTNSCMESHLDFQVDQSHHMVQLLLLSIHPLAITSVHLLVLQLPESSFE